MPNPLPKVTYIDGYHGGIAGHMPLGSLRDVLRELADKPWWAISLEIEPFSWDAVRRRDPQAYAELQALLRDNGPDARVELVSGAYAQPFCWAFNGESNIRHLLLGRVTLKRHFPEAVVDTYAVQEPCWTSALPQILRSLGYRRASLKNPSTAWGGYAAGFDASVVDWVGPDGSRIPTVPRYACEELRQTWQTESIAPSAAFAAKCAARGVMAPAGMCYQDMGWPAHPAVDAAGSYVSSRPEDLAAVVWPDETASHIRYATWRRFFERFAPAPEAEWRFSQEDIHVALPWGASELQRLARQVRAAENRILVAEKVAALAWARGVLAWPAAPLAEAWRQLLLAQHHDAWIVFFNGRERRRWSWQVGAQTWVTEQLCDEVVGTSLEALAVGQSWPSAAEDGLQVGVVNTLGTPRDDLVVLPFAVPPDVPAVRVIDDRCDLVPSQVVVRRTYRDGTLNAGELLFRGQVPALGHRVYRVTPDSTPVAEALSSAARPGVVAALAEDGTVTVDSDRYRLVLDPERGGAITLLYDRRAAREVVAATASPGFGTYRGYFPELGGWAASSDSPADVEIIEAGPVRVRVAVRGQLAGAGFRSMLTVVQGEPRIDIDVAFDFPPGTRIGEPWDGSPTFESRRRPCYDDRYKLQAVFPVALESPELYKSAAYDVCRSTNADTFFNSWDAIKHNVILDWVDLYDREANRGFALLSDHTTSYAFGPGEPLGLVLGYSGPGTWGYDYPIVGALAASYSLLPHDGDWMASRLWRAARAWAEPLLPQIWPEAEEATAIFSLIAVLDAGTGQPSATVDVPSMLVDGDGLMVRLFNASTRSADVDLIFGIDLASAAAVELDGRPIEELPVTTPDSGPVTVRHHLRPFGLATVRAVPRSHPPT